MHDAEITDYTNHEPVLGEEPTEWPILEPKHIGRDFGSRVVDIHRRSLLGWVDNVYGPYLIHPPAVDAAILKAAQEILGSRAPRLVPLLDQYPSRALCRVWNRAGVHLGYDVGNPEAGERVAPLDDPSPPRETVRRY